MSPETERVVVVTGGARGIGRAICRAFAAPGTHVCFNYLSASEAARQTEEEIAERGGRSTAMQADVTSEAEMRDFFSAVADTAGRLDVLVNNAGITRDGLVPRMKEADWDDVMAVNLKGAFFCIKAASRQMLNQRQGRIINIGSVVGQTGNAGQANYAAAKAGLIGLTRSVALEFASRNITANAIAAGLIRTDMAETLTAEKQAALESQIPLGRMGRPEEVAAVALFLASEAAAYITGQVIAVNGGLYM